METDALQPWAVQGSHPMPWLKDYSTGCKGRRGHLHLWMIWAADLGFGHELKTEHLLFPCSPSATGLAVLLRHCAASLVAVQEHTSQPACCKSASFLPDLLNWTGEGGKTKKQTDGKAKTPKHFLSAGCWLYLELWLVYVCIQSKFSEEYPAVISQRVWTNSLTAPLLEW